MFTDEHHFHAVTTKLRKESPVHWVEHPDFNPFWVLTKHADVLDVELHPNEFLNAPRAILGNKEADSMREMQGHLVKSLVQMDDPEHRNHRNLTADWFLPKNLATLDGRLKELADRYIDKMVAMGGQCDFASDIAMQYPLYVILAILGLPESDYNRMLRLTQELFGAEDDEFKRDDDALASILQTVADFVAYFDALTEDRRTNPTSDLASVIANGMVNGEPIGHKEQLGYYIIAATAGHDTTSNAMGGAMKALIENPDQLARLQANPSLMTVAVDEMIRWTSPVKHFMRTATVDYEIRGTTIKAGQDVLLSYWAANRDEDVFDDPFKFDIGRAPNKHLAFGFGVHYCLGAMLARMELKALFGALLPRLKSIELAGTPQLTKSTFVSGVKHLPIRYEIV
ncbi:MAG: cytochrome P450 [Actinobacteria bacterium]|nr:cytochrome P450 [Actinomycetota bacterium]MSW77808.1 cytochrome P450 [Actinomycetota bacterium]MSZ83153.1 cytochrome P450 [Actinomycetota bacterium]MTB18049.1 cytochrome P450 [Actinomycetota bacterium]